jgi:hypothetical protein
MRSLSLPVTLQQSDRLAWTFLPQSHALFASLSALNCTTTGCRYFRPLVVRNWKNVIPNLDHLVRDDDENGAAIESINYSAGEKFAWGFT